MEQLSYLKERSKSPVEMDRCDHLTTCLLLSCKLESSNTHPKPIARTPQRPKTAMAALGGNIWDPYETTMNREYTHKGCPQTQAVRPKTSKGYRNPYILSDPVGISIYSDEFSWKPYSKPEPIRAATASGARSNNPIPNQAFMIWRLPREEKNMSDNRSPLKKPLTPLKTPTIEEIKKAMKAQYCTTYRDDYVGIPQGFQVKYAINSPTNWKTEIPHPPDTETRFNYQIQPHAPELLDFTHKYGCYANRRVPAKGSVPTVIYSHIRNQENRKHLTTYQRHYGKEYVDLAALASSLDPEDLRKYLKCVLKDERRAHEKFAKTARGTDIQNVTSKLPQTQNTKYFQQQKKM
ncbi:testis-expressed protein 26 [Bombina bombina]|uniref:testis-expressed protein 26 n=1 Tax=Bombina bombina TaxID=8345 RepID=UPI00235AC8EE|nr:testis-expressed protein 26 [Bombina bombina]